MKAIIYSTVILHSSKHYEKMQLAIEHYGIGEQIITRISYLEILAGVSENANNGRKEKF